jgi:hypothetical protein
MTLGSLFDRRYRWAKALLRMRTLHTRGDYHQGATPSQLFRAIILATSNILQAVEHFFF